MNRPEANSTLQVAALFAGIGGLEVGFARAGLTTSLMCEVWEPAKAVLAEHFPSAQRHDDVRVLDALPDQTDVISAGFPCTDLSQAGRTAGIRGSQSGLVSHVFRLLDKHRPTWLVLENVRNMLPLDGGRAMEYLVGELETRGYAWAYRVVDSRFTGVPQRRQRVLLVASPTEDPRAVLLSEDRGERTPEDFSSTMFGFYWTEGLRGLGWAQDALPTLKGGSAIGIPSPPAIWVPNAPLGERIVTPSIEAAEQLQGFPRGWTKAADVASTRRSVRWKLVGNAVTVGVAKWLGRRLKSPGRYDPSEATPLGLGHPWPSAAWGAKGERWRSQVSMWPTHWKYRHLSQVMRADDLKPLSYRAASGFLDRALRAKLRFDEAFLLDVKLHVEAMEPTE